MKHLKAIKYKEDADIKGVYSLKDTRRLKKTSYLNCSVESFFDVFTIAIYIMNKQDIYRYTNADRLTSTNRI